MNPDVASIKLNALRNSIISWLDEPFTTVYEEREVKDLFDRFVNIREELRKDFPTYFSDLPTGVVAKPLPGLRFREGGYYKLHHLQHLLKDVNYCLDILKAQSSIGIPSMKVSKEGVFFAGQYFDALNRVSTIIEGANKRIDIIDGYINEDVLNLLTNKKDNVMIRILTKTVNPSVGVAAKAFNKQYGGLSIRTSKAFHDRFIIIDGTDFFHFGASIKDAGNRGFMFSKIEEGIVIKSLWKQYNDTWNKSKEII